MDPPLVLVNTSFVGGGLSCNSTRVGWDHQWFAGMGISGRWSILTRLSEALQGRGLSIYSTTSLIRAYLECTTNAITRFTDGGERLENEAREAKKGLWADLQPVPSWVYREARRGQSDFGPSGEARGNY